MRDVWAKFDHAEAHRESFQVAIDTFTDTEPYGLAAEFDAETGWNTLVWQVHREPPEERFALLVGDALSNLRASLDYLVWQLVLENGETPARSNAFPVAKTEDEWAHAQRRNMLRGVAAGWIEVVKELQPLNRPDPVFHELALLDHLNNINKHRFIPAVLANGHHLPVQITTGVIAAEAFESQHFLDTPIENGAPAFRVRCASKRQLQMNVDGDAIFRISFRDGLERPWDLVDVFTWVKGALTRFEPAFAS